MGTGVDVAQQTLEGWVLTPLRAAWSQLVSFAPAVLGALAILLIGWSVARGIEWLIVQVLKTLTLDKLADQVQLSTVLSKGGIKRKLSELVGAIAYWIVMLAFVVAALNALNLTVAADLVQKVVSFLPNVIAAIFILIVGAFAATFLAVTVRTAASNSGIVQSHLLGQTVQTIVIIFAVVAALQQLQIQFVGEVFIVILGGISLGCALAFGLGCRDLAGRWVSDLIGELQSRRR